MSWVLATSFPVVNLQLKQTCFHCLGTEPLDQYKLYTSTNAESKAGYFVRAGIVQLRCGVIPRTPYFAQNILRSDRVTVHLMLWQISLYKPAVFVNGIRVGKPFFLHMGKQHACVKGRISSCSSMQIQQMPRNYLARFFLPLVSIYSIV